MFRKNYPGIFLMAILLTGAVLAIPVIPEAGKDALPPPPVRRLGETTGAILSGEVVSAFQNRFEEAFPLREPSIGVWASIRYTLFREGLPGLAVGHEGWLFSAEEFSALPTAEEEEERIREAVDYIAEVEKKLQDSGVRLIMVPVPAKARIYREYLGRHQFPEAAETRYRSFLEELKQREVESIDLVSPFLHQANASASLYLRTDTHWTPAGANLAAAQVNEVITADSGYQQLQNRDYRVRLGEADTYKGDLLNFLPLGTFRRFIELPVDKIPDIRVEAGPAPALGLFDTAAVPVVLLGTSYSAGEQWGFAAFLQEELQLEVLNLAEEGEGPYLPVQRYLESDTFLEAPPKFVIWEFPERYLILEKPPF